MIKNFQTDLIFIPQYTIKELMKNRDPDYLRHDERTDDLKESVLVRAYASTVEYKTKSSKFESNGTWWRQWILLKDFVVIARDRGISLKEAIEYAINEADVHVACNCPAHKYWAYEYMSTQLDYAYGPYRTNRSPTRNNVSLKGTVCFGGETRVLTEMGEKRIDEIELGELVYTHTGELRKVKEVSHREGLVREIDIKGRGKIKVTDEHPIWTSTRGGMGRYRIKDYEEGWDWQAASKIQKYDLVAQPKLNSGDIENKYAFEIGYYYADGYLSYRKVSTSDSTKLYNDKVKNIVHDGVLWTFHSKYLERMRDLFYKDCSFRAESRRDGANSIMETQNRELMTELFPFIEWTGTKFKKKLPLNTVLSWDEESRWEFLRGFFLGDGTFDRRGYIIFVQKDNRVLENISWILNSLGVRSIVNRKGGQTILYKKEAAENIHRFSDLLLFKGSDYTPKPFFSRENSMSKEYFRFTVRGVSELRERKAVYNLEVEGLHTYLAEGIIVHNCKHTDKALRQLYKDADELMQKFSAYYKRLPEFNYGVDEEITDETRVEQFRPEEPKIEETETVETEAESDTEIEEVDEEIQESIDIVEPIDVKNIVSPQEANGVQQIQGETDLFTLDWATPEVKQFYKKLRSEGESQYSPDSKYSLTELIVGTIVELEHVEELILAKEIAKDHLEEIPDYYTRLLKMESDAKRELNHEY